MIGYIDQPIDKSTLDSDNFFCAGWAYSKKGIRKITVFIDNIEMGDAEYGIQRKDLKLAYPEYPDIENSGFILPINKSLSRGDHHLKIKVFEKSGVEGVDLIETVFTVDKKKKFIAKFLWIASRLYHGKEKPLPQLEKRKRTSEMYLTGDGIEIGALHNPLPLGKNVRVRYVDRFPLPQLNAQYAELDPDSIVKIDLIDNGEILSSIEDESINFIIANHFLEHCENPLGTIRNHLSKINNSGILYYAIPEKSCTFDSKRPVTTFEHLMEDDRGDPSFSRKLHMQEWVTLVEKNDTLDEEEKDKRVQDLLRMNYSIHFHAWDIDAIFEMMYKTREYLDDSFRLLHFEQNGNEIIVVLQKK